MSDLPTYVDINNPDDPRIKILRSPARTLTFPLTPKDLAMIQKLEEKFDQENNCAGLAAPQVGYDIRAIVFKADDPEIKKWRPDFTQTMPKTIWLNPSYEPIGPDKTRDYEGCFSAGLLAGPVERFTRIRYEAYLIDGTKVQGEAEGFLARIIQHEVDHTNGHLFIEFVPDGELMTVDEYRARRARMMKEGDQ